MFLKFPFFHGFHVYIESHHCLNVLLLFIFVVDFRDNVESLQLGFSLVGVVNPRVC
jgi:hypothetical protein